MKIIKIQKFLSIIPYFSTYFIIFASMFLLKRFRVTFGYWLQFFGICIAVVTCGGIAFHTLSESHLLLAHIICILIYTAANFLFIRLQEKAYEKSQAQSIKTLQEKQTDKKSAKYVFGVIGISMGAIAVVILVVLFLVLNAPDPIEDQNGADTSLAVLTLDDVLAEHGVWEARFCSDGVYGNQTNVDKKIKAKKYDYDKCTFKCGSVSGVKTMQITNIDSDILTLKIDSVLESGNMEIFILVDGSLYEKVPVGQLYETTLEGVAKKNVEVRFAAEAAKLSMTVIRDYTGA